MAIDPTNQRKHDFAVGEVSSSELSAALKEDVVDVLGRTLASTNGMTTEEKIQATTQNQFDMMRLFALQLVATGRRVTSWKDVIIKCRWQLCLALGTVAAMLVYRPELAAMVETLAAGR
ncbi:MAG: hypothetical protein II839_07620 [Kiritimatiellae bacterium]|jgi:hypothetical protein|nr:hypothetical protein [Kiritimatiellia bacterium]